MALIFPVGEGALHFGEPQVAVFGLFGLIALTLAAVFTMVARMSRADVRLSRCNGSVGAWSADGGS